MDCPNKEIIVGKTAGFCFGVKRAIDLSKTTASTYKDAYCVGSIVHNKFVNDELKSLGLHFVKNIEEVPIGSKVIIRAHGVTKDEMKLCESRKLEVIDTTCPNVKKIHEIVSRESNNGYKIIIIGDKNHPEVIGISGWVSGEFEVLNNLEELENREFDKICIVSQTTMDIEKNEKIVKTIKNKAKECIVYNTICMATENRQKELKSLAKDADYVIVIGDKGSANSNRLYEIAKNICNSQFIENIDELDLNFLEHSCKIIVMAGASTPKSLIDQVVDKLK